MPNKVQVIIDATNHATPAIRSVEGELGGLGAVCERVGKTMEALGIAYAAEKLMEFAKQALESAVEMGHLSEKTGVAVEELSGLAAVAKISGVSTEGFEKAMKKLAMTLSDAGAGNAKATATLQSLGMSSKDASGHTLTLSDALLKIADRFEKAKDGTEKAAVAQRAFGKSGMDMIPFLDRGAAGIEKLITRCKALGIVMNAEDVEAAQALKAETTLLNLAFDAQVRNLMMGLVPALMDLVSTLTSADGSMSGARTIGEGLGVVFKSVATIFLAVGTTVEWVCAKLKTLAEAMANIANGDWKAAAESLREFVGIANDSFAELANNQLSKGLDALWGKHETPKVPHAGGGGNDEIKRQQEEADAIALARLKAQMENEKLAAAFTKSMNAIALQQLEAQYKLLLVPVQEYFKKKRALEEDDLQAEIFAADRELQLQDQQSKKGKKPQDRIEALQKVNELTERLTVLQAQLAAVQGKNAAGGDDPMLLRVRNMQEAQVMAQQLAEQLVALYDDVANAEKRLAMQVQNFAMTPQEEIKQLNLLHDQAAVKVAELTKRYQELAQTSGDPKLIKSAQDYSLKLDQLRQHSNQLKDAVGQGLTSGFDSFFSTLEQSGNAAKAFENFATSMVSSIEKIINQMMAMWLVQKAMGMLFPGAGAGGVPVGTVSGTPGDVPAFPGSSLSGITFAAGGASLAANQPAIIGEAGPELWVPTSAGQVIPNNVLKSSGGGGNRAPSMQVTVVNNGAPKNAQASQPSWNEQTKAWHMQLHLDDALNNGPLSAGSR